MCECACQCVCLSVCVCVFVYVCECRMQAKLYLEEENKLGNWHPGDRREGPVRKGAGLILSLKVLMIFSDSHTKPCSST